MDGRDMAHRLKIEDIHFAYGEEDVIRGVSFEMAPSEIVGILGPNGAGKSTLIKLMAGLFKARSGEATLGGEDLHRMPAAERAREIAFVPQESHIPFSFTAMEVVLMGRSPHLPLLGFESRRDIAIAHEAMEKTDCLKFAPRDINSLSGGERQRVILARALAQEPKLLFLDEPTTFLDIRHQIELHRLFSSLSRKGGLAIAAAMHDLNLAAAFCDRLIVLKEGRITAAGKPRDVITSSTIFEAFGARVLVGSHPSTGTPYCIPPDIAS
ncbi:MAG: heme ABC transporter ATP-binding protein [Pseudomonadota bacterium]